MKPKTRELSWTPHRNGEIYCAPACGRGCTYTEFLKAINDGNILAIRCGAGYTRVVHENMGWHFHAVSACQRIRVHQDSTKSYTAMLCDPESVGGRYAASGPTPKKAITAVVEAGKADLRRIGAIIRGL